jgi:hypothetical protein
VELAMKDRVLYGAVFGAGVLTAALAGFGLTALHVPHGVPVQSAGELVSAGRLPSTLPPLLGATSREAPAVPPTRDIPPDPASSLATASDGEHAARAAPASATPAVKEASPDVPSPPAQADLAKPLTGGRLPQDRNDAGPRAQTSMPVPTASSPARPRSGELEPALAGAVAPRVSVRSGAEAADRPGAREQPRLPQGLAGRPGSAATVAMPVAQDRQADNARVDTPASAAAGRRIANAGTLVPLLPAIADRAVDSARPSAPAKLVAVETPTVAEPDRAAADAVVDRPARALARTTARAAVVRAWDQRLAAGAWTESAHAAGVSAVRLNGVAPARSSLASHRFALRSAPPQPGIAGQEPPDAAARPAGLSPPVAGPPGPRSWLRQQNGRNATRSVKRQRVALAHPRAVPATSRQPEPGSRVKRSRMADWRARPRSLPTVIYGTPPLQHLAPGPVLIRIHAPARRPHGPVRTTRIPSY